MEEIWWKEATKWVDVFPAFMKWLEEHTAGKTFAFVTCGNWDVGTQIPKQCEISELKLPPIFDQWVNIKDIYLNFYTNKLKPYGMASMLKGLNIELEGHHHLGIDDTKNITKIVQKMLADGAIINITAKKSQDGAVQYFLENRIKPRQHKKKR